MELQQKDVVAVLLCSSNKNNLEEEGNRWLYTFINYLYPREESPDSARRDTGEIPGAERLRKVQQKTLRYITLLG